MSFEKLYSLVESCRESNKKKKEETFFVHKFSNFDILIYCRIGPVYANNIQIIENCNPKILYYFKNVIQGNTTIKHLNNTPVTFISTTHNSIWNAGYEKFEIFTEMSDNDDSIFSAALKALNGLGNMAAGFSKGFKDLAVGGFKFLVNFVGSSLIYIFQIFIYFFIVIIVLFFFSKFCSCFKNFIVMR